MDVDVFCLFPLCPLSHEVLTLPHNQHAVTTREAHCQSTPDDGYAHSTPQLYVWPPSIEVKVPERFVLASRRWSFKFSNHDPEAEILLPAARYYGNFTVTLWYARSGDPTDGPALMVSVDADRPSAFSVRIVNTQVMDGAVYEYQKCLSRGNYHLRNTVAIHIGPHSFQIGKIPVAHNPADLHWRLCKVAHQITVRVEDDEWGFTGRVLGRGSYGTVFLVIGMLSGALRAMKSILIHPDNPALEDQIVGETEVLEGLNNLEDPNPHMVKYYGYIHGMHGEDRFCQIIFQACHGDVDLLIRQGIAIAHFPSIALHIGSMIQQMHRRCDMMHRDIKPHNMLFKIPNLDEDGYEGIHRENGLGFIDETSLQFYLGDFGSCRSYEGRDFMSFCGTPQYSAPEITVDGNVYTKAADICSFGISLLEILDREAVNNAYNQTVGASGLTMEDHEKDPRFFHQYIRALQRLPTPSRVQGYLWSFLKKMVAFDPAARPTIDVVMNTLSTVRVTNTNGGNVHDALVFTEGHWEAAANLRVEIETKD